MMLADWLVREGIGRKAFGARIEASPATMTDLCSGRVWVRAEKAIAIERETGGEVTVLDLLKKYREARSQGGDQA